MKRNYLIRSAATAAGLCAVLAFPFTANATTVDDVAAVARQYGLPESVIQQGYNEYYKDPDLYSSEALDEVIEDIRSGAAASLLIKRGLMTNSTTATTTTAVTTSPSGSTPQTTTEPVDDPKTAAITLTDSNGNSFTRISREDFIKLSYDEKMAYLGTFTPEQQQTVINDLSPEEYRSILKQAPPEVKIDVVSNYSKAAEQLGINITIDEISGDSLSVAMRNDDGELVGVANAGHIVEDTGYDRSSLFYIAGALFSAAGAGIILLMKKCFGKGVCGR